MSGAVDPKLYRARVDARLENVVAGFASHAPMLVSAMAKAVSPQGKRFRGTLMLILAGQSSGVPEILVDAAAAIEVLHAASLIIDDLPAMDDAKMRRGAPTNHLQFGEDRAILGGIALVAEAVNFIAKSSHADFQTRIEIIESLTRSIGSNGLCAGQELDLHAPKTKDGVVVEHDLKTGALFVSSFECVAIVQNLSEDMRADLVRLGLLLGRAFQLFDDLKDHLGTVENLGKDVGKDAQNAEFKAGFLAVSSLDEAFESYKQMRVEIDQILSKRWPDQPSAKFYIEAVLPKPSQNTVNMQNLNFAQSSSTAG